MFLAIILASVLKTSAPLPSPGSATGELMQARTSPGSSSSKSPTTSRAWPWKRCLLTPATLVSSRGWRRRWMGREGRHRGMRRTTSSMTSARRVRGSKASSSPGFHSTRLSRSAPWPIPAAKTNLHMQSRMLYASTREQLSKALSLGASIHADRLDDIDWNSLVREVRRGRS